MPHVIVKLHSGRTEEQKKELADELTKAVIKVLKSKEASISIGIEDIDPADWAEKVHKPDISAKLDTIYKQSAT